MAWTCIGFDTDTDLAAASALPSVPSGCDVALITAEVGAVRWRADGTSPTNDIGHYLAATSTLEWRGPFDAIEFIRDDAGQSPTITVSYFSFG
jgi:hypothetical protein